MRAFTLSALSLLALGVAAAPSNLDKRQTEECCMPAETAVTLANAFAALIGQPFNTTLADDAMSPTFMDYSDSVIELINAGCPPGDNATIPLGMSTFPNRAAFIMGQSGQAPIPFQILNVWPACNSVAFRWRSSAPGTVQPEQFVTGIIVLETVIGGPFGWQIQTTYSEFNSGAWLYDLGIFVPKCAPAPNSTASK